MCFSFCGLLAFSTNGPSPASPGLESCLDLLLAQMRAINQRQKGQRFVAASGRTRFWSYEVLVVYLSSRIQGSLQATTASLVSVEIIANMPLSFQDPNPRKSGFRMYPLSYPAGHGVFKRHRKIPSEWPRVLLFSRGRIRAHSQVL